MMNRTVVQTVGSFLKLTRFWNLLIIALAQLFTARFLIGAFTLTELRLYLLVASTLLIAAAGYIINDYYDVKIDYINKPHRVIVGKQIPRRYALLYHTVFSVLGILIGVYLSLWIGAVNLFCAVLLWWYSNHLKRLPFVGNLAIGLLTGLAVAVVSLLYWQPGALVPAYAVFALFMTVIREVIKDIEDVRGDDTYGCQTLPIVWGIRRTKIVVYAIAVVMCVLVFYINSRWTHLPVIYLAILLFIPLGVLVGMLYKADTQAEFHRLNQLSKFIMLLGIGSMMFT